MVVDHSAYAELWNRASAQIDSLAAQLATVTRERDEARAALARLKADQRIRDAYDGPGAGGCADLVDP